MEADAEQLSHHILYPRGGPSFRPHHPYHSQHNFNFLIICFNSPVPHGMLGTQSLKTSSYRKKLHTVIMFLITAFGGYVQIQYQSKDKSPFDDHAAVMTTIFTTLCLYALSLIAEYALPSEEPYLPIIKTFGPLLGFLVLVLLLIILVPVLGIIASIIWGIFVMKAGIMWLSRMAQCLRQVISGIIKYFDISEPSHSLEVV